jgi:hypothetical protein
MHFIFETGSGSVAQAGVKLIILPPQPPDCWDYRCAPPGPTSYVGLKSFAIMIYYFTTGHSTTHYLNTTGPFESQMAYFGGTPSSLRWKFSSFSRV